MQINHTPYCFFSMQPDLQQTGSSCIWCWAYSHGITHWIGISIKRKVQPPLSFAECNSQLCADSSIFTCSEYWKGEITCGFSLHRSAKCRFCLCGYIARCCILHHKTELSFHLMKMYVTQGSVFPQLKKLEWLKTFKVVLQICGWLQLVNASTWISLTVGKQTLAWTLRDLK